MMAFGFARVLGFMVKGLGVQGFRVYGFGFRFRVYPKPLNPNTLKSIVSAQRAAFQPRLNFEGLNVQA